DRGEGRRIRGGGRRGATHDQGGLSDHPDGLYDLRRGRESRPAKSTTGAAESTTDTAESTVDAAEAVVAADSSSWPSRISPSAPFGIGHLPAHCWHRATRPMMAARAARCARSISASTVALAIAL